MLAVLAILHSVTEELEGCDFCSSCFKPTPWCRAFLEKLEVTQLVKKFPAFVESEGALLYTKIPPLDPFMSHLNPVCLCLPSFSKKHSNIILPSVPRAPMQSLLQANSYMYVTAVLKYMFVSSFLI